MNKNLPIIDNKNSTMEQALLSELKNGGVSSLDVSVGFFYFSGWQLLAQYLKDIPVRVLAGSYVDPKVVKEFLAMSRRVDGNVELNRYAPRDISTTRTEKAKEYINSFVEIFNESSIFDDGLQRDALSIFQDKIKDGSLQIKLSNKPEHGKLYLLHRKEGVDKGVAFMGSSNFTYNGLILQGELNEDRSEKFEEYSNIFLDLWEDSDTIDVVTDQNFEEFKKVIDEELWINAEVDPFVMYIRILHELFGSERAYATMKTPAQITNDQYTDLAYQVDAIGSAIEKVNKYDGVIIADVVGLGKSIIASAVANNLDLRTVIIAPPHLKGQWEDYQAQFALRGARVFSSGNIKGVYEKFKNSSSPILLIVDEAHRFRNEDTDDYKMLWNISRSNSNNKVVLLTATPFNNDPKDVFALIKLFQTPGRSTIRSIDNMSIRFRELIARYKRLNRDRAKGLLSQNDINEGADEISKELRRLIEAVVIRRSRLDLEHITKYREDLKRQNIGFAKVQGPDEMVYQLGDLSELYSDTLDVLTDENAGLIGARYMPTKYILDSSTFLENAGEDFDESDLQTAQVNLASFMKRLLVMRFESSKEAFRRTLDNVIASNELILRWYDELGKVPIYKKGQLPDPDNFITDSDDIDGTLNTDMLEDALREMKSTKGLITIEKNNLEPRYREDLSRDIEILKSIHSKWFDSGDSIVDSFDPKAEGLIDKLHGLLLDNPERKIVIFSSYADTVEYLYKLLREKSDLRVFSYTSKTGTASNRRVLQQNFDASIPDDEQSHDFDIVIATDAISEGFNLHRAGVVINYDIPYNPTRVIQRVGRINRINKKVFDKLYIYNYFPTDIGEDIVRIQQITTLKVRLINSVMGSDTRTLQSDEEMTRFVAEGLGYKESNEKQDTLSWDAPYREIYEQAREDKELMACVLDIKPRSRVVRDGMNENAIVGYGKKGDHGIFALKIEGEEAGICASEDALPYFEAVLNDKGHKGDRQYDEAFTLIRDELFSKHDLPEISGRRLKALEKIEFLINDLPGARNYCVELRDIIKKYDDLSEGALKDIAQLRINDSELAFQKLKEIIPEHQVEVISQRVNKIDDEHEIVLLSQEHRI